MKTVSTRKCGRTSGAQMSNCWARSFLIRRCFLKNEQWTNSSRLNFGATCSTVEYSDSSFISLHQSCLTTTTTISTTSKMARPRTSVVSSMCRSCRISYLSQSRCGISSTTASQEAQPRTGSRLGQRLGIRHNEERTPPAPIDAATAFSEILQPPVQTNNSMRNSMRNDLRRSKTSEDESSTGGGSHTSTMPAYLDEPYHLNVYAHRHNTHITFTEPSRNPIISYSCGNLGLRNAQKASYDASFQLAAYTFRKMAEKQWKLGGVKSKVGSWLTLANIKKPQRSQTGGAGIEVVMRGYGPGREAFQKALLGTEGRMIKQLIVKVTDATRLKFGGTRSPQVRRLG